MALKVFDIEFREFSNEKGVRNDFKYFDWKKNEKRKFISKIKIGKSLNSYYKGFAFKGDDFSNDGETYVLKGVNFNSDYSIDFSNIQYLPDEFFDNKKYKNFRIKKDDIIFSLVGSIGKIAFIDTDYRMLLNQNNIALRPSKDLFNLRFFTYIVDFLLQEIIQKLYSNSGYSFLRIEDLFDIEIPLLSKPEQDKIVAKIEPIEQKIKDLKSKIKPPQEIINKVFAREFGFDQNLFNEFGKGMTAGTQIAENRKLRIFETNFEELSRSGIVRFSTRFHNSPTKKLMDFLDILGTLTVKNILLEAIHRGASPKYNPDGNIPVIKTGHLKNGYIEISQDEFVDESFYKSSMRSQIRQGDILIASTGKVSLGKIDLLEDEQELVADGHISIIRIDTQKYSPQFFTYFFRSVLGYFQIERDFTGATNQIELYGNEISNFKIPNISLSKQQKIVDEIKAELDKQEKMKKQIETEREKIDGIIEQSLV